MKAEVPRSAFALLRLALSLCLLWSFGCGTSSRSGFRDGPRAPQVELTLRRASGEWIHLGDLQGKPLLLYFFATYDASSQAALRPTSRFAQRHEDVHVVGVAVQPNARELLLPYESALRPLFPLTYDPEDRVRHGESSIGHIDSVPMYMMFDANGRKVGTLHGFPSERALEALYEEARSQGVENERRRPLIGISSPR